MTVMIKERVYKSQFGYSTGAGAAYAEGGGDISFAVNQIMFFRFATTIPKGSTINSATLTFALGGKNLSPGNYSTHTIRAHASGDSALLRPGSVEHARPQTSAAVTWTPTWATGDPVYSSADVKTIFQEFMNRSDFQTGGYITFMITCTNENGTDMAVRCNNDFAPSPKLTVDYTEPVTDTRWEFNRIENSEFNPTLNGLDGANPVPGWGQNEFYGFSAAPANQGTLAIDTSFTRVPGIPTLRFTTGTPAEAPNNNRSTGPYCAFRTEAWEPTIFCGWIYIPTSISTSYNVRAQEAFNGGSHIITARGVWTPFCTNVITSGSGAGTRWWAVLMNPYVAGQQFWISEPTYMTSAFRQMPFNGLTPAVKDVGGSTLISHRSTAGRQQSVREWIPRTAVKKNGVLVRAPRYIKRTDGLLQLAEPVKGGPTVPNMPAVAISSYPAGKTISEL